MQTFLPYSSFLRTCWVLDNKRLGKQRVEALQILRTCVGESSRWRNHPAVLMWKGHERDLVIYGSFICDEWAKRGFKDTVKEKLRQIKLHHELGRQTPPWLGYEPFHAAHRSNLLRKDPEYYGRFGWTEGPELPYVWPTKLKEFQSV